MISIYLMKSIYKKINISPSFILIILLSLVSGLFKDIMCLFLIIIIHETGHVITSILFNWKISNIRISIVGGYITYDEEIDKPFIEELIISISGILMQVMLCLTTFFLFKNNLIDNRLYLLISKYNNAIMLFNLLPIIPLDGSKVVNTILSVFLPFKKVLNMLNYISLISIILIIITLIINKINFEVSYIMLLSILINKIIEAIKLLPHVFNKFLFERYTKEKKYKKSILINGIYDFYRQKNHYSYIDRKYCNEREILHKRFDLTHKI